MTTATVSTAPDTASTAPSAGRRASDVRIALACGLATVLGSLAFVPVVVNLSWLPPIIVLVGVITAVGIAVRAIAPLRRITPLVQLLAGFVTMNILYAEHLFLGVVPTPGSSRSLGAVLADGLLEVRDQAPPVLAVTSLTALITLAIGLVAIAVEVAALSLRRPAVAGLLLLIPYLVPIATIVGSIGWVSFLGPALGYLLLLFVDHREGMRRWGATVRAGGGHSPTGLVTAGQVGLVALALGLLVPLIVPTWPEGLLGQQLSSGGSGGTGTSLSPLVRLQGELTLPEPQDLLRVEADVDDPYYLRSVALDSYDEDGWSLSNLSSEIPVEGRSALQRLPGPQVVRTVTADVEILEHDDQYLPAYGAIQEVEVTGNWRFDEASGTIFSRDGTTGELTGYRLRSREVQPTAEQLGRAEDLDPDNPIQVDFTALPTGLDPTVAQLVDSLVGGVQGPYERALAINGYLTDRGNGFIYSLTTEPGTSGDDLVDFLDNKQGYCEQYAGAMAVMLRLAGIPARVVLGYTGGTQAGDGVRTITTDDAHAWVEAYLNGFGWISFDPTPIGPGRAAGLDYAPRGDSLDGPDDESADPEAAPAPPVGGAQAEIDEDNDNPNALDRSTPDTSAVSATTIGVLAGLALLVVALIGPALIRIATRRRRLRPAARSRAGPESDGTAGPVHAAWDELTDSAADLGLPTRPEETPRMIARRLVREAGFDTESAVAVRELALAEERARYARPGSVQSGTELAPQVRRVRRALVGQARRRARWQARLLPRSTMGRLRPRSPWRRSPAPPR